MSGVARARRLSAPLAVVLAALACARAHAAAVDQPLAQPLAVEQPLAGLGDGWVGGFELPGSGRREPGIWVSFANGRWYESSEDSRGTPLLAGERRGADVRFDVVVAGAALHVAGRLAAPDLLRGEVTVEGARGPFELTRTVWEDATNFHARTAGTYVSDGGATFLVTIDGALRTLFDVETGQVHALFRRGDGSYDTAPGSGTIYPKRGSMTFDRAPDGRASGLAWRRADGSVVVARRAEPRVAEVRFTSAGTTLVGTLSTPLGPGPYPLVVDVHGSGRQTRRDPWIEQMTAFFLREGFAVFAYDKRGAGASGGAYVGEGAAQTDNTSPRNLELLAKDVRAAVNAAAARPEIDRRRVGLFGISQAGWIMPLAAVDCAAVKFLVMVSGPIVPTSLEALHSLLLHDGLAPSDLALDQVDAIVRRAPREGFDSAPYVARLKIPALFLYGALDSSIPVPESARVLARLRKGHDFDVVTFADAGHELFTVPRDTRIERYRSPGLTAEELPTIRRWLRAHHLTTVATPRSTTADDPAR